MFKAANVGSIDRMLRLFVGVILIATPYVVASELWINPLLRWGVPIVGLILVLTALVRFCPLYRIIGANTCKTN